MQDYQFRTDVELQNMIVELAQWKDTPNADTSWGSVRSRAAE